MYTTASPRAIKIPSTIINMLKYICNKALSSLTFQSTSINLPPARSCNHRTDTQFHQGTSIGYQIDSHTIEWISSS
ncbi:hypothetical protein pb186bvf_019862 [Paramecium bursaria]